MKGQIAFQEIPSNESGLTYVGESWGLSWGDFNGDGYPDIWACNHASKPSLYLNNTGTSTAITTDGLLSHYDFEEGSGFVAEDVSGNGNDGIINGGAAWTTGANEKGGGLEFNGVDVYVDIGDIDLADAFSISAWIKVNSLGKLTIVGKTFQTYQFFVSPAGNLIVQRNGGTPIDYNAGLVPCTWYHVAVTFDMTNGMSLYLNGILASSNGDTTTTNQNNVSTKIGATTSSAVQNYFYGVIDEVRIYNRALTSQEIQNMSKAGVLFSNIIDHVWSDDPTDDTHAAQWIDFDNDGDQDICELTGAVAGAGSHASHMFVNEFGLLVDRAASLGLDYPLGRGRTPLWFDYDRDGLNDVFITTQLRLDGTAPSSLFRNTGSIFVDVSDNVGLNITQSYNNAQLGDLNGDGVFDLIPTYLIFLPPQIYDMSTIPFTDIGSTFNVPKVYSVWDFAIADFNNDGLMDAFVVNNKKPTEVVQLNNSVVEVGFVTTNWEEHGITFEATGNTLSFKVFADFYQEPFVFVGADGHQPSDFTKLAEGKARYTFTVPMNDSSSNGMGSHDRRGLYIGFNTSTQRWELTNVGDGFIPMEVRMESDGPVSNITAVGFDMEAPQTYNALLINDGTDFSNMASELGVNDALHSISVVAGDFDNDMDVDVYIVNTKLVANPQNVLYENMGDGSFVRVADAGGAEGSEFGRGDDAAIADYDNDGFLDIAVVNGNQLGIFSEDGPTQLFRNIGNSNNWIQVVLEGTVSNRDGIGARVYATAGGVQQLREQNGGMHSRSQNYKRLHFGMGSNTTIDKLEVYWPSGIVQTLRNVNVNQILHIAESEGAAVTPTPIPSASATPTPLTSPSPVLTLPPTVFATPSPVASSAPAITPTPVPTASPSVSPTPTLPPELNLIAYYAFEEGSGSIAVDSSGNGNDGVVSGGAVWTSGVNGIGGGLSFDGVGDSAVLPLMNNDEMTVSAWFYKNANDTTNADAIFGAWRWNVDVQNNEGFELRFFRSTPDILDFILITEDAGGMRTKQKVSKYLGTSAGSWYHVVGTYNKNTGEQKLYINGQLEFVNTHPAGNTIVPLTVYPDVRIGHSWTNNGYFNGIIDEVKIYDRALNDQDVFDLFNQFAMPMPMPTPTPNPTPVATITPVVSPTPVATAAHGADLIAYYAFEGGNGVTVADSSGNGNNGVISGGAVWTSGVNGIGGGLSFDGVDDSVVLPLMNNDEMTVSAWFYKNANDTTNADAIFGAWRWNADMQNNEGFDFRFLQFTPDILDFILITEDSGGTKTNGKARNHLGTSAGIWYHMVGTYNAATGEQKLYINGQLVSTYIHPAGNTIVPLTTFPDMRIGHSRTNNGYFNGIIDEVKIYDRAITDQDVFDLFNQFTMPTPTPVTTVTPVVSPTPLVTPSPEPTATVSPTAESVVTPTPVTTVSPVLSPTPAVATSPTPTATITPAASPWITPAPNPVTTATPLISPTPAMTPTPSPVVTVLPTASPWLLSTPTPLSTVTPAISPTPQPN